ncbi:baseplate protein [Tumebacillus algifaecis]|uniref:Baseplate protein n=1 Tax=Tumebacillus algifaecis TaxID=1214604 RepID=A0A223D1R5_9BACL|nr:GPW/gp25 family protein [Tumebacillus algifaecis]ASS75491.1 baseplate protein [Tumebacillus algifaecis]
MGKSFLGRGWKFPIEVDPTTGRIAMSEHEDDIAEAIRIILWTAKGERVMRPDFGCAIHNYIFETTDPTTISLMEAAVSDAITAWEPRVHEIDVKISLDDNEAGKLHISVSYVVRTTNNLYNQVYPFYMHEGTK